MLLVLASIEKLASATLVQIARMSGLDKKTVTYLIDQAREEAGMTINKDGPVHPYSGGTEAIKAFEVSDRLSREVLMSESLRCDEVGNVIAIIGEGGNPLHLISDAPDHIQEAVQWLVNRKLATVVTCPEGDEILVLVDEDDF
jgi:hypothetical protein